MTETSSIRIGPFELHERAGVGGNGIVYRALHRPTQSDVAVKVLRGEPDDCALRAFRREVQAHAGLQHPSIVQLLDYGEIDERVEADTGGDLKAGSPYIVMEYASRGTLRGARFRTWSSAYHAIRPILEGLAHAHARGVIHRDLKPGNLLFFESTRGWTVKLTDFGIAHALQSLEERGTESLGRIIGTPKYMAPEQLLGRWRDHGPWTDLYAMGCIVYQFVCGAPPYASVGTNSIAEAVAHFSEPIPPVAARFDAPPELRDWLLQAMAVEPSDRFARAAEALEALPGPATRQNVAQPSSIDDEQLSLTVETAEAETVLLTELSERQGAAVEPDAIGLPIPPDWRPFEVEPDAANQVGLGLVGLRNPPLVGRENERDLLWNAFVEAAEGGAPRLVSLDGEAGIGKSRLAEWLTTLAHEVAGAQIVRLGDFSKDTSGLDELLRTWQLPRHRLAQHLNDVLPHTLELSAMRELDVHALVEILRPRAGATDRHTSSLAERFGVVERVLQRYAAYRPTIVWFDDLHAATSSIEFARRLLTSGRESRILCVATVRSDLANENLARLHEVATDRVQRIRVEALDDEESTRLATRMARLPEPVVRTLVERMEGNPLFGLQLLTGWVERGLTATTEGDVQLDETVTELIPGDIHAVWLDRIDRIAASTGAPDAFRHFLELAGTLGKSVTEEEWAAIQRTGTPLDARWWPLVTDRGLARRTQDGWEFRHGLLVQSLHQLARESGAWEALNRRCARALTEIYPAQRFRYARRLADHWIEGGRKDLALEPLLQEAERTNDATAPEVTRDVLETRRRLIDDLGMSEDNIVRAENELELLRTSLRLGAQPADVYPLIIELVARAEQRDSGDVVSKAWRIVAMCCEASGDMEKARAWSLQACEAAEQGGSLHTLALAKLALARSEFSSGRPEVARSHAADARQLAEQLAEDGLLLRALQTEAWAASMAGAVDQSKELFGRCLTLARREGASLLEADAQNGLGDLHRQRHEWEQASERYQRAADIYHEIRHVQDAAVVDFNLAAAQTGARNFEDALARLDRSATTLLETGFHFFESHLDLLRLAIAAGTRDWDVFDALVETIDEHVRDTAGRVVWEDAQTLELAETFLAEAGETARAANVRTLRSALEQKLEDRRAAAEDA